MQELHGKDFMAVGVYMRLYGHIFARDPFNGKFPGIYLRYDLLNYYAGAGQQVHPFSYGRCIKNTVQN